MDTFLAIASRRDQRRYVPGPLPDDVVRRILDAGRLSGSSGNRQPWTFVVVEGPARVEALSRGVFVPDNVLGAGLVVAVVVAGRGPVSFDAGRAAQNMLLAAWNEGVASCPNGLSDRDAVRAALDLDAGRLSGSSGNRQPWTFVVVEGPAHVEALARGVFVPGNVLGAGLVVAIVVAGKGPVSFDAGRAAQNMLLAAWNEGVASCPNGLSDRDAVRAALDLDEDEAPAIVLTFGLPERRTEPDARSAAEWSMRANRRPLDDVVRRLR